MANINATLKVRLESELYKITIDYNTYEKAPYDTYLITSLVKSANGDEKKITKYIDEISGDGSLNEHFKKLYEEVKDYTKEQVDTILDSSLFPVRVCDNSNSFLYYPDFDISQLHGKFYPGNLNDNRDLLKSLLVDTSDDKKTFIGMEIEYQEFSNESKDIIVQADINRANVSILMSGLNSPITMSVDGLANIVPERLTSDIRDDYKGEIISDAYGSNWYLLSDKILQDFLNGNTHFYGNDRHLYLIYPDKIEGIEVTNVASGIYFYRKTTYDISMKNSIVCTQALNYLVLSNKINEMKNDSILNLVRASDENVGVYALNTVLGVKDAEKLASYALTLIKNGHTDGWGNDALRKIKGVCKNTDYAIIYPLSLTLDWNVKELLHVPDEMLIEVHKKAKNDYITDVNFYHNQIKDMLGEFSAKGVREDAKKLGNKDQLVKDFNKFLNEYLGHNHIDILAIDDVDELKKHYNKIKNVYDNQYPTILKRLDALKNGG